MATSFYRSMDVFLSLEKKHSSLLYLYGGVPSLRTFWLNKYLRDNSLSALYVYTKTPSSRFHKMTSMSDFCFNTIIGNEHTTMYDLIILDDFNIHSLEKQVFLRALSKGFIQCRKLIVLCPSICEYLLSTLEKSIRTDKRQFLYFTFDSMQRICTEKPRLQIHYRDYIENDSHQLIWEFNSKSFISFPAMCDMIDSILEEIDENDMKNQRILVYVQSPEMCDTIMEHYHTHSPLKVASVHGQKSKKDICSIVHDWRNRIVFSTNIRWKNEMMDRHLFTTIIDFGLVYKMNEFGFLSLDYCTKSELEDRTKIVSCGKVYRILSKQFYDDELCQIQEPIFDWKKFIIKCALHNKLQIFISLFSLNNTCHHSQIMSDISGLVQSHILRKSDYEFVRGDDESRKIMTELLKSPLQVQTYTIVMHLCHIHQVSSLPQVTLILSTMMIALIDTISKYGRHRFFDLPRISNRIPSQVLDNWLRVLLFCSGDSYGIDSYFMTNRQKFLWLLFEVCLTIVVSGNPRNLDLYNLQYNTWNEFVVRWKCLYRLSTLQHFENSASFLHHVKLSIEKHTLSKSWCLENKTCPTYLFRKIKIRRDSAVHGNINYLQEVIKENLLELLWKLSSSSTWVHHIYPHSRKLFLHDEVPEPYITVDLEHHLYLPFPNFLLRFLGDVKDHTTEQKDGICFLATKMKDRIKTKKQFQENFKKTVVEEIENEVAYRPNKVKYYEIMDDFQYWQSVL